MVFKNIISTLRKEEQQLVTQLSNVRNAINALGSNLSYIATGRGRPAGRKNVQAPAPKRRTLSAKARNAISKAQKLRWAKQKAGAKKSRP